MSRGDFPHLRRYRIAIEFVHRHRRSDGMVDAGLLQRIPGCHRRPLRLGLRLYHAHPRRNDRRYGHRHILLRPLHRLGAEPQHLRGVRLHRFRVGIPQQDGAARQRRYPLLQAAPRKQVLPGLPRHGLRFPRRRLPRPRTYVRVPPQRQGERRERLRQRRDQPHRALRNGIHHPGPGHQQPPSAPLQDRQVRRSKHVRLHPPRP